MPRSWSLVWLAGAHREVPDATPVEWRERWAAEAARYGQAPLPATFEDAPNAGVEMDASQAMAEARGLETVGVVRRLVVPRLLQVARDRGWWDPLASSFGRGVWWRSAAPAAGGRTIIHPDAATWERLSLAPRVVAPSDPAAGSRAHPGGHRATARTSTAAVDGTTVVGARDRRSTDDRGRRELLALGVAPAFRGGGSRTASSGRASAGGPATRNTRPTSLSPSATRSNRSIEPSAAAIARRLLERAGFRDPSLGRRSRARRPGAFDAVRRGRAVRSSWLAPRLRSRRAGQPVAEPVLGRDVRLARCRRVQLQAQVADRHPQQVDVDVVAGAPHRAEHLAVRDELAGVLDEVGEQPELGRGQADLVAAEARPMLLEVDDEVAMLEPARPIGVRGRRPDAAPPRPARTAPGSSAAW